MLEGGGGGKTQPPLQVQPVDIVTAPDIGITCSIMMKMPRLMPIRQFPHS